MGMKLSPQMSQFVLDAKRFYEDHYRAELEATHHGQFAAVDLKRRTVLVAPRKIEVMQKAMASDPESFVFLIQIGYPTADEFSNAF